MLIFRPSFPSPGQIEYYHLFMRFMGQSGIFFGLLNANPGNEKTNSVHFNNRWSFCLE
jgi:hypothetical protein